MTWREIEAAELHKLHRRTVIDVRSPCEFAVEKIPGALNVPLLEDDERALIGTIYATEGEMTARRRALTIISPKIPSIVEKVVQLKSQENALVVHCWRGGLRSEAVVSFLAIVGINSWRLKGGYKSWRRHVLTKFEEDAYEFPAVVLHGSTGTGKTEILEHLSKLGASVLDLEKLCNHRGSVFGDFGLGPQPTQKNFEGELFEKLESFGREPVFIEAEGRRVGKLSLPDLILSRIKSGTKVLVTGSNEARLKRLLNSYGQPEARSMEDNEFLQSVLQAVRLLKERIGSEVTNQLEELIEEKNFTSALEILLTNYYDPMYARHIRQNAPFALTVNGDDPEQAAKCIYKWSTSGALT